MRTIEISDESFAALLLAARLSGRTVGGTVDWLVQEMAGQSPASSPRRAEPVAPAPDEAGRRTRLSNELLPIHALYLKEKIKGRFNPVDESVTVTSGALAGKTFGSPSEAALEVVRALNPSRKKPETNGRLFWIVDATNQPLRSVMGKRS